MKRFLAAVLGIAVAFAVTADAQPKKKQQPSCPTTLAACPDEGCGSGFDPNLNRRKNIRPDDPVAQGPATVRTLTWIKKLDDPENFAKGDSREELEGLGEGQKITMAAYLLRVKPEGAESCNCRLTKTEWTDNQLVLVSKWTVDKFPLGSGMAAAAIFKLRENESITAEFTPRVRLTHPNFTRARMEPLIAARPTKALLVRVTGKQYCAGSNLPCSRKDL